MIELENQLDAGHSAFQESEEASKKAESIFQQIYQNVMKVFKQAETVKEKSSFLQSSSDTFVDEVTSISDVTEKALTTIKQMYSVIEEQRHLISNRKMIEFIKNIRLVV